MDKKNKKIYLAVIIILVILIVTTVIVWLSLQKNTVKDLPKTPTIESVDKETLIIDKSGITANRKEFDTTVIEESLKDVGFLITEEYLFTEVASFDSTKSIFGIELPFTESSYLESYDGHVSAGIEFGNIKVTCNEEKKELVVTLPEAEIKDVVIDPESFKLYSEKNGFGNKISVNDFNISLSELKLNAKEKAIGRNILGLARDNAKILVSNLIKELDVTDGYKIIFD